MVRYNLPPFISKIFGKLINPTYQRIKYQRKYRSLIDVIEENNDGIATGGLVAATYLFVGYAAASASVPIINNPKISEKIMIADIIGTLAILGTYIVTNICSSIYESKNRRT